ncbi:hypothetical protein H0A43_10530 [Arcobacter lanthieri]|uniref:hypothetical protein n=1 Tax=Aliarcobacter lanthieri TaxID=1355374 RepID=UPI001921F74E|nr:hypothetical protein [Aliarcobacter lanthieri]MBL3520913.1 hypothetical protein [Aliarcobacter lanthieri]
MNLVNVLFISSFTTFVPIFFWAICVFIITLYNQIEIKGIVIIFISYFINAITHILLSSFSVTVAYFLTNKNNILMKRNFIALISISIFIGIIYILRYQLLDYEHFIIIWILFSFLSSFLTLKFYK